MRKKLGRLWLWACMMFLMGSLYGQHQEIKFVHYNSQDGLPSTYIKDIAEDHQGFIWLANRENICRFDGYQFKTLPAFDESGVPVDLRPNTVDITSDSLLICSTVESKFFYFDALLEEFHPYDLLNGFKPDGAVVMDHSGFWLAEVGEVKHINRSTQKVSTLADRFPNQPFEISSDVTQIFARDERLVLATADAHVIYLSSDQMRRFEVSLSEIQLLYIDDFGNLWVGGYNNLIRIDLLTGQMESYSREAKGNRHLPHGFVHKMVEDQRGRLWIATEGGVAIWKEREKIVQCFTHQLDVPSGLSSDPIYSALCDSNGNVWLGSYFSGINLWSSGNYFFQTLTSGVSNYDLSGNAVSCFTQDAQGNLWVGLEDNGVNRIDHKTGKIKKYTVGSGGLSYGNVHNLYFENERRLWIATYTGGINILDPVTDQMQYLNTTNTPNLLANDIYFFYSVGDSLFFSTSNGVNLYNKRTREITPFHSDVFGGALIETITETPGKIWFSSRIQLYYYDLETQRLHTYGGIGNLKGINFVKADSEQNLWVGDSFKGLFRVDLQTQKIDTFNTRKGFPGSWIYGMQEGTQGWYWVSTDKGLVKLYPETKKSVLFNADSGVPVSQFNYRAAFKDENHTLYFGSNQGLVYFNEANEGDFDRPANQVIFTGFRLFNLPVGPSDERGSTLKQSITRVDSIELDYDQNVFTIEYSAKNYGVKGKCHYAYFLEGFESDYNYVGNQNFATYTNLNPGRYVFKVKASLNNSNWDADVNELVILVHPPFWLSKWGYAFYAVILLGILITIYLVGARIQKSKAEVEIERKERSHAVELNQIKLEFFTNISHELRTPLTLIIGPLSKLLGDERVSPSVKGQLSGIELNAKRLLGLLNQLLDFRKIERGMEELSVTENRIEELFSNLEQSFKVTAEENGLDLVFKAKKADEKMWYDVSKVEKILINLISNAFKFTDEGGQIKVQAKIKESKKEVARQELHLVIEDTGRGMEPRVANRIFDRFYQSKNTGGSKKPYYGSGIGLAFVHSLVELHKGSIEVKSQLNVGSVFEVTLPVSKEAYEEHEIKETEVTRVPIEPILPKEVINKKQETGAADVPLESTKRPVVLLVEDNQELIDFVASTLEHHYVVLKAPNGQEGLKKLEENQVDLILSDVMMPVMDGFEFAQKVKSDIATSHIPIILLTAKSGMDNRYEGLKTGADYYIEKPFMSHILEQNIYNVLNTRRNLIHRYKRDAMMPTTELTHSESDKAFIDKLTNLIKDNIAKPDLDVSFVMDEMALSRSMLHIKLKKIADCSATEFINTVRLKEALRLMADEGSNISEAAYRTGFSSPTYFTRRFKQYYGQSPRDFLLKGQN